MLISALSSCQRTSAERYIASAASGESGKYSATRRYSRCACCAAPFGACGCAASVFKIRGRAEQDRIAVRRRRRHDPLVANPPRSRRRRILRAELRLRVRRLLIRLVRVGEHPHPAPLRSITTTSCPGSTSARCLRIVVAPKIHDRRMHHRRREPSGHSPPSASFDFFCAPADAAITSKADRQNPHPQSHAQLSSDSLDARSAPVRKRLRPAAAATPAQYSRRSAPPPCVRHAGNSA